MRKAQRSRTEHGQSDDEHGEELEQVGPRLRTDDLEAPDDDADQE